MNRAQLIATALSVFLALPAAAQIPQDVVDVSILPGWREADGRHVAGLSIRLAPGWKTYWRAPGDGGIPPNFDWTASQNVVDVGIHFPVPSVFRVNGVRSIGYSDAVLFPLLVQANDPSAPMHLSGEVELGVCQDICIPVSFRIDAALPAGGASGQALSAALRDRPSEGGDIRCDISPIADGLRLRIATELPPFGGEEVAIVEAGETGLWISEAEVTRNGDTLTALVEMVPPNARPFALARSDVRVTVLADGRAVEMLGCD